VATLDDDNADDDDNNDDNDRGWRVLGLGTHYLMHFIVLWPALSSNHKHTELLKKLGCTVFYPHMNLAYFIVLLFIILLFIILLLCLLLTVCCWSSEQPLAQEFPSGLVNLSYLYCLLLGVYTVRLLFYCLYSYVGIFAQPLAQQFPSG